MGQDGEASSAPMSAGRVTTRVSRQCATIGCEGRRTARQLSSPCPVDSYASLVGQKLADGIRGERESVTRTLG